MEFMDYFVAVSERNGISFSRRDQGEIRIAECIKARSTFMSGIAKALISVEHHRLQNPHWRQFTGKPLHLD